MPTDDSEPVKGTSSNVDLKGFWSGSEGALLLTWCVIWPLLLAWASVASNIIISVMAIAVLVLTPTVIYLRQAGRRIILLKKLTEEQDRHIACHRAFNALIDELTISHRFRMHEAVARELEMLSDELQGVPRRSLIDPSYLANVIEHRVAYLRRSAPDPPSSLFQRLIDESARSEDSVNEPTDH